MDYKEAQWVAESMALKLVAGQILAAMFVGRSHATICATARDGGMTEVRAAVVFAELICKECDKS